MIAGLKEHVANWGIPKMKRRIQENNELHYKCMNQVYKGIVHRMD